MKCSSSIAMIFGFAGGDEVEYDFGEPVRVDRGRDVLGVEGGQFDQEALGRGFVPELDGRNGEPLVTGRGV